MQHTACHHRTRCTDIGTNAFGAGAGQASEAVADLVAGHDVGGCRVCSTRVGGLQLGEEGLAEVGHALGLQRERHMGLHQLPLLLPVQLQRVLHSPLMSGPALLFPGLWVPGCRWPRLRCRLSDHWTPWLPRHLRSAHAGMWCRSATPSYFAELVYVVACSPSNAADAGRSFAAGRVRGSRGLRSEAAMGEELSVPLGIADKGVQDP